MTFREFLKKRRVTYDACGDFVNEALRNERLAGARSWEELNERVGKSHGFTGVEAARTVWQSYVDQSLATERANAKGA